MLQAVAELNFDSNRVQQQRLNWKMYVRYEESCRSRPPAGMSVMCLMQVCSTDSLLTSQHWSRHLVRPHDLIQTRARSSSGIAASSWRVTMETPSKWRHDAVHEFRIIWHFYASKTLAVKNSCSHDVFYIKRWYRSHDVLQQCTQDTPIHEWIWDIF